MHEFQSSAGQKAGCNEWVANVVAVMREVFQSSPGQKAGCNGQFLQGLGLPVEVSILTRPEGRVQLSSIEARNQEIETFQSSPGQKAGCNLPGRESTNPPNTFQSSPGQKAGCNLW